MAVANNRSLSTDGIITKHLFRKTMITMLFAELAGGVTAIIDGILAGGFLGESALAASGLGSPYYSVASIISGILMTGSTNLCTNAIGKGDREGLNGAFSLTLLLSVLLSGLLAVFGFAMSDQFATLFGAGGATKEVFAETSGYLRGLFVGAPGFIIYVVLIPMLQLDGDSVRPSIASFARIIADVIGDLLNIFVFHGGMFGMGLTSSISHYIALVIIASHFLKKGSLFRFSFGVIRIKMALHLLTDGLPRALCMLSRGILPIVLNMLLLRLVGDPGVTALSAMTNSSFIVGALGWGIGGAMLILGGMMYGEQDVGGFKDVWKNAQRSIVLYVTVLAAAVFLCAPLIARLFVPQDGPAYEMSRDCIRCYAVCLPFLAFNVTMANYLQVLSRKAEASIVNIAIEVLFTAAMAYILSSFLGALGVFIAFPAGQALLSLCLAIRLIVSKTPGRSGIEAHMLLPKNYGVPHEDCLERSIHTMEEVVESALRVEEFCVRRGVEPREAKRLALCVEEMAGNTVKHGFSDGKPHHLDMRVLVKDGSVILRLRDDCTKFDFRDQAECWQFNPEHPEKNIGIRLVLKEAKDIAYTNVMNTNNLIIKV